MIGVCVPPKGRGLEPTFFLLILLSDQGSLGSGPSWPGQSWIPEQEAARGHGGEGNTLNDEGDYFSCDFDREAQTVELGLCPLPSGRDKMS